MEKKKQYEYGVAFTDGATEALRIVGEHFPWSNQSTSFFFLSFFYCFLFFFFSSSYFFFFFFLLDPKPPSFYHILKITPLLQSPTLFLITTLPWEFVNMCGKKGENCRLFAMKLTKFQSPSIVQQIIYWCFQQNVIFQGKRFP